MRAEPKSDLRVALESAEATAAFGAWLGDRLSPGDSLLLSGPIGAGKTHLARALIRIRMRDPQLEVPSPTFTLVQSYEAVDVDIWHADLYRLSHPDDVIELGLDDAFQRAIVIVEWPDRLGRNKPPGAISIALSTVGEGRTAQITGASAQLVAALRKDWGATDG
jgi:tRNA threonylcarbamoyladenosine biosynthesis protein TsaE